MNTIETFADEELVGMATGQYGQVKAAPPLCQRITPVSFGISRLQAKMKPDRQDDSINGPLESDSRTYYVHQLANPSRKEELSFIVGSLSKYATHSRTKIGSNTSTLEVLPYSSKEEQDYLERQSRLFKEKLSELIEKHLGKYVLFENGEVLFSHEDEAELMKIAYEKMGLKPLFVRKVSKEETKFSIWTPLIC